MDINPSTKEEKMLKTNLQELLPHERIQHPWDPKLLSSFLFLGMLSDYGKDRHSCAWDSSGKGYSEHWGMV